MVRATVAAAVCLLLVALAFVPPLVLFALEHGRLNVAGTVVAVVSCCLLVGAFVLLVASRHRKDERVMPSGVRIAVTANVMFLAFFALEMCDLLVRRDEQLNYWTNYLIPPGIVLFVGLLRMRPWAWWVSRGIAAFGVLWFIGFTCLIPYGNIARDGVPAPFEARLRMMVLSLLFAGILAAAYWSIGRRETRKYFGMAEPRV